MDFSLPSSLRKPSSPEIRNISAGTSPPKTNLHVNFDPETEEIHERKKYLTAKYGQHQMGLIKKRLRVEMWMYDQLQSLYGSNSHSSDDEVEIDLDELLDIENELARRVWLKNKLTGVKKSESAVDVFISELLKQAKTL